MSTVARFASVFRMPILVGLIVFLLTATGCTGASGGTLVTNTAAMVKPIVLSLSGSGSTTLILEAIKPAFEADTPGIQLDILSGTGTSSAMKGLLQKTIDIVAMARLLKPEEVEQNIKYVSLGRASQAILVHPNVHITNLTSRQVLGIFAGDITNWLQVGGADAEIILYVRDEGDSTTEALRKNILHNVPFPERTARILTSQKAMQTAIAGTPASVGIGTWSAVVAAKAKVQPVAVDGVSPKDPRYSMFSPLGIGYLAERQADLQPLIDWLMSARGRTALMALDLFLSPR